MSDNGKKNSMALVPTTLGEVQQLAAIFAKSNLLPPDLKGKEPDVFVAITAGLELGMAPMAALRSIHVVKGKPILSADAMVGVALASGTAEYFANVESTPLIATYETKRRGSPMPQRLSFTIEEARLAGLGGDNGGDNWKKYPAAMLRARAKAALCRDVYPDALAGVYTEDEARGFTEQPAMQRQWQAPPASQVIDAEVVDEKTDENGKALLRSLTEAATLDDLQMLVPALSRIPKDSPAYAELRSLYGKRKVQFEKLAAQAKQASEPAEDETFDPVTGEALG